MNFNALRNAPSKADYENSFAQGYYAIIRAHGRKLVITACILAVPLVITGQIISVLAIVILIVAYRYSLRRSIRVSIEQAQLSAFARDNGWTFATSTPSVSRAGSLFENGAHCMIENHLVTPRFEVGRCVFVQDRDVTESVYKIRHFFGLYLPKTLPHLLVNAKANENDVFMSWLPHLGGDVRKLSLEGDFDKYFTLYAPRKYDTDARVIFSPDVMRAVIRHAKRYDIEIIGDRMYFYCDKIEWLDETFWQHVDNLAGVVEKEIGRQATYYTDEHEGKELSVAKRGMGLRMIIDMPLWAKLWIGGIVLVMSILVVLMMLFPPVPKQPPIVTNDIQKKAMAPVVQQPVEEALVGEKINVGNRFHILVPGGWRASVSQQATFLAVQYARPNQLHTLVYDKQKPATVDYDGIPAWGGLTEHFYVRAITVPSQAFNPADHAEVTAEQFTFNDGTQGKKYLVTKHAVEAQKWGGLLKDDKWYGRVFVYSKGDMLVEAHLAFYPSANIDEATFEKVAATITP